MVEQVCAKIDSKQTLEEKIDAFAKKVVELRLDIPTLLFLELQKPLTTILHTSCLLFQPIATPLFGAERVGVLEQILSDRENIEKLMCSIERQVTEPKTVES